MGCASGEQTHHDLPAFTRGAVLAPYTSDQSRPAMPCQSIRVVAHRAMQCPVSHHAKNERGGSHEQV